MVDGQKRRLEEIRKKRPEEAAAIITGLLKDEYRRLEEAMRALRASYVRMDVDDPAQQNDVADLRLQAIEAYRPAYIIEDFLANMGVDVIPLMPHYKGAFEASSYKNGEWTVSLVSLKENAMRTLGGHCNVIGDVIILERLLYDSTYLAAVMRQTDDYQPGKQTYVELDSYTVVFDEDIQAIVRMPYR
ncbi:hypothetical protein Mtc_0054 [Methanocella conradii HZ254]|uniref:Uncharacterized protein n=1 Tax=Methanocella conradii (strain DSM 24694 / JCM 17849 / CGMCC 1.5162 / HZ254) TaxID=1041930 RepID=H8I5D5_METCZ|nr:hypothetical protein [Methanocella conradii]AFC98829.1 hypothetical protein Mtc_0054 [Methanocella conradii HZ254]